MFLKAQVAHLGGEMGQRSFSGGTRGQDWTRAASSDGNPERVSGADFS
jgi:hypothetical protein